MANRYASTGQQGALGTTDDYMLEILGGTGVVVSIYHILIACEDTPVDEMATHSVFKLTAGGTATSVTPEPLDAIRALAAEASAAEDHTVDPTTTGIALMEVPVHTRATLQWMAPPGGEFISALAAGDGYGFASRSPTYTGSCLASVYHEE